MCNLAQKYFTIVVTNYVCMRFFITLCAIFFSLNIFSQDITVVVVDTTDIRVSYRVLENMFGDFSNDTWTVTIESSYLNNTNHPEDAIISLCKFEKEIKIHSKKIKTYNLIYSRDIANENDAKKLKALLSNENTEYYLVFKDDIKKRKAVLYEIYINLDYIE